MSSELVISNPDFDHLIDLIAPSDPDAIGMVAPSSGRIYRSTYNQWRLWCNANLIDPLEIHINTVKSFLEDRESTKSSKKRDLSALRLMAHTLTILDHTNPMRAPAYNSLKLLKLTGASESERDRRALKPADADRMLRVWSEDETLRGKRNRAIIAAALLSGLRRAELTALKWSNIDLEAGTIKVKHGKGDKSRTAALYGDEAIAALREWYYCQPDTFEHVFVALLKGGKFDQDKPLSTTSIWRIVDETARKAAIDHVKPHDLRRTLATELLNTGSPVHHVQQQLGHSDSSTTLNNYTAETDAIQRRQDGKLRYG